MFRKGKLLVKNNPRIADRCSEEKSSWEVNRCNKRICCSQLLPLPYNHIYKSRFRCIETQTNGRYPCTECHHIPLHCGHCRRNIGCRTMQIILDIASIELTQTNPEARTIVISALYKCIEQLTRNIEGKRSGNQWG